jgi:hypothetical protein
MDCILALMNAHGPIWSNKMSTRLAYHCNGNQVEPRVLAESRESSLPMVFTEATAMILLLSSVSLVAGQGLAPSNALPTYYNPPVLRHSKLMLEQSQHLLVALPTKLLILNPESRLTESWV